SYNWLNQIPEACWLGPCHPPGQRQEGEARKRIFIGEENNSLCVRYEDGSNVVYSQSNNAPELLAQFLMLNADDFGIKLDPKSDPNWPTLRPIEYCEECGCSMAAPQPDAGKARMESALREISGELL